MLQSEILSTTNLAPARSICQGPEWVVRMQYSGNIHTNLVFIGLPNQQGMDSFIY